MLPDVLAIKPFVRPLNGSVVLPGSKSLTNRALLVAALCPKPVLLTGALFSEDTHLMAEALRKLGFTIVSDEAQATVAVSGQANAFKDGTVDLFVGLAGTAARFLTALCAAAPRGIYRIDGVPQMRKRPMLGLIAALRQLGADIRCTGEEGFFPIEIHARGLRGGPVSLDARESSQMLSALLMAAPLAAAPVEISLVGGVRWPFVQMTARLMEHFGQPPLTRLSEERFVVSAGTAYQLASGVYAIEPDATAASYFNALPLVAGGRLVLQSLRGPGEGLQGDTQFAEVMRKVGVSFTTTAEGLQIDFSKGAPLQGVTENFNTFSDTFLTLAALAPLLKGPTRLSGLTHTRKQETDRVAGMAKELKRLGQEVIETEDALEIHPRPLLVNQEIETYHDHRFAMSFGILGSFDLLGNGQPWLKIKNPACCAKTFPHFFELLESLRVRTLSRLPHEEFVVVAIDGGAASGKSSTSRALSERFHLMHVDTGSFYRAVTAEMLRGKISSDSLDAVRTAVASMRFGTRVNGRSAQMEINGRPVDLVEIRTSEVNASVSHFAAVPEIRTALLAYQRGQADVARAHGFRGLVMEGRDIGSVIFPDARFRFFLHADPVERARRRAQEGVTDSIAERDRLDTQRKTAPLASPPGATVIDSTLLNLEQVVDLLAGILSPALPNA